MTDPLSSLPGLQAALIEYWRSLAAAMYADSHKFPDRFTLEKCANDLSALLVVQGGVQQDEKAGNTDTRVDLQSQVPIVRSTAQIATGDVPSLNVLMDRLSLYRVDTTGTFSASGRFVMWGDVLDILKAHAAIFGVPSPATARPTDGNSAQSAPTLDLGEWCSDHREFQPCTGCDEERTRKANETAASIMRAALFRLISFSHSYIHRSAFGGEYITDDYRDGDRHDGTMCVPCIAQRALSDEAQARQEMERTTGAASAIDPIVGAPHDGLRATSLDSSTTSPTHGGTPQENAMKKDAIDELLGALDALYRYASDDGCPNAESHKFSRPNRARLVIEVWLKTQLSAHGGTAPHPEPDRCVCGHLRCLHRQSVGRCGSGAYSAATPCRCATFSPVEAGTAAASLSHNEEKEKNDE